MGKMGTYVLQARLEARGLLQKGDSKDSHRWVRDRAVRTIESGGKSRTSLVPVSHKSRTSLAQVSHEPHNTQISQHESHDTQVSQHESHNTQVSHKSHTRPVSLPIVTHTPCFPVYHTPVFDPHRPPVVYHRISIPGLGLAGGAR